MLLLLLLLLLQDLLDALPLALSFWALLGVHELGHSQAASKAGVQLYWPLTVPAGFAFLGSFGGITRFKGFVPDRNTLLKVMRYREGFWGCGVGLGKEEAGRKVWSRTRRNEMGVGRGGGGIKLS